jgi:hypothetical protein
MSIGAVRSGYWCMEEKDMNSKKKTSEIMGPNGI